MHTPTLRVLCRALHVYSPLCTASAYRLQVGDTLLYCVANMPGCVPRSSTEVSLA